MGHNIIDSKAVVRPAPALLIIVDYSNWLYRAYFSGIKDVLIKPWMPFNRALEMLKTCIRISRDAYPGQEVKFIFCGDSVRKKLPNMKTDEFYKPEKPGLTDLKFYIFRNIMNLVVKDLGCDILYADGYEADELIASIVKKYTVICPCEGKCTSCKCSGMPHDNDIVIFTQDKDLEICLSYKYVNIYKGNGKFYKKEDYISDYGFDPKFHLTYKALVGDRSDNINCVPTWGEAKAKEHILTDNWFDLLKKDPAKLNVFNQNIRALAMNWDIPINIDLKEGLTFTTSEELLRKLQSDYHQQEAIDDVIFGMKCLIESVK